MTNSNIYSVPQSQTAVTPSFAGLPDEVAVNLVARLQEIATTCKRPFTLDRLNPRKHPRGLCIGLTNADEKTDSIAVFYVSAAGQYAWQERVRIHVTTPANSSQWTEISLEIGMEYLFCPSSFGNDHVKAEPWGKAGSLKSKYNELHSLPPEKSSGKKQKSTDDESSGAPPALRPKNEILGFTPLDSSLDSLGL